MCTALSHARVYYVWWFCDAQTFWNQKLSVVVVQALSTSRMSTRGHLTTWMSFSKIRKLILYSEVSNHLLAIFEKYENTHACACVPLTWFKLCFYLSPTSDQRPPPRPCRAVCQLCGWRWAPAGWASESTSGPSSPLSSSPIGISTEYALSFSCIWLFCLFPWVSRCGKDAGKDAMKERGRMLLRKCIFFLQLIIPDLIVLLLFYFSVWIFCAIITNYLKI